MPDEPSHLSCAAHNEAFLQTIDRSVYPGWSVTVAFYTALHYLDAFFARNMEPELAGHTAREGRLRAHPELRGIVSPYLALKSASVRSRYYDERPTLPEISKQVEGRLTYIRNFLLGKLR